MSHRDSRRAFTQTQKKEILYQQDNLCASCHNPLDPRTVEFDHIQPWAAYGRTITVNGAALHAGCHRLKTHNERLREIEGRRAKTIQKPVKPNGPKGGLFDMSLPEIRLPEVKLPDFRLPDGDLGF